MLNFPPAAASMISSGNFFLLVLGLANDACFCRAVDPDPGGENLRKKAEINARNLVEINFIIK